MRKLALAFFAAVTVTGCAGTYTARTGASVTTYTPELVAVSPGVSVVADYHEPVFYSDNTYWRYDDRGRWYRSTYYDRGWVSISTPPVSVTRIERPYSYRRYRPAGYVRRDDRREYRRDYNRGRVQRPVVRDHRR